MPASDDAWRRTSGSPSPRAPPLPACGRGWCRRAPRDRPWGAPAARPRVRQHGRQQRRLTWAELRRVPAEMRPRRRLCAIDAAAPFDEVEVELEDALLAQQRLDDHGEIGLGALAQIAAARPQQQVARELLADGAGAAQPLALAASRDRLCRSRSSRSRDASRSAHPPTRSRHAPAPARYASAAPTPCRSERLRRRGSASAASPASARSDRARSPAPAAAARSPAPPRSAARARRPGEVSLRRE